MLSAVKSAFTTEPTPQTVDPLKFQRTEIPVAESRHAAIQYWGGDNSLLMPLKTLLNKVGLDLAMLDGKFVTQDREAYITTKNNEQVARLTAIYRTPIGDSATETHIIQIEQKGDKEIYGPVYNDALNVVKFWASGKSGGMKKRRKTHKKKRVSRKTKRHSR